MIETEAKVRVFTSIDNVRRFIESIGFRHVADVIEEDTYFDHPCRSFRETDEALRVRLVYGRSGCLEQCILTYKGRRTLSLDGIKSREELNVSIDKKYCRVLVELLDRLGFKRVAVVRKNRAYYRRDNIVFTIDDVECLGVFIEIEGSRRDVEELLRQLPFKYEAIAKTYLEMMLEECVGG